MKVSNHYVDQFERIYSHSLWKQTVGLLSVSSLALLNVPRAKVTVSVMSMQSSVNTIIMQLFYTAKIVSGRNCNIMVSSTDGLTLMNTQIFCFCFSFYLLCDSKEHWFTTVTSTRTKIHTPTLTNPPTYTHALTYSPIHPSTYMH